MAEHDTRILNRLRADPSVRQLLFGLQELSIPYRLEIAGNRFGCDARVVLHPGTLGKVSLITELHHLSRLFSPDNGYQTRYNLVLLEAHRQDAKWLRVGRPGQYLRDVLAVGADQFDKILEDLGGSAVPPAPDDDDYLMALEERLLSPRCWDDMVEAPTLDGEG